MTTFLAFAWLALFFFAFYAWYAARKDWPSNPIGSRWFWIGTLAWALCLIVTFARVVQRG